MIYPEYILLNILLNRLSISENRFKDKNRMKCGSEILALEQLYILQEEVKW